VAYLCGALPDHAIHHHDGYGVTVGTGGLAYRSLFNVSQHALNVCLEQTAPLRVTYYNLDHLDAT